MVIPGMSFGQLKLTWDKHGITQPRLFVHGISMQVSVHEWDISGIP